jgi:hypothetical protein
MTEAHQVFLLLVKAQFASMVGANGTVFYKIKETQKEKVL